VEILLLLYLPNGRGSLYPSLELLIDFRTVLSKLATDFGELDFGELFSLLQEEYFESIFIN
jgi:hypothetical protein